MFLGQVMDMRDHIDSVISDKLSSITSELDQILKNKQREKSDLQQMNLKLIERIDTLSKKVNETMQSIDSICTITLCLIESQCMQIRAEEVDEMDKAKIALMGSKDTKILNDLPKS